MWELLNKHLYDEKVWLENIIWESSGEGSEEEVKFTIAWYINQKYKDYITQKKKKL